MNVKNRLRSSISTALKFTLLKLTFYSSIESKIRKGHKMRKIILRTTLFFLDTERFLFGLAVRNKFGKGYGLQARCKKKGRVTSYFQII